MIELPKFTKKRDQIVGLLMSQKDLGKDHNPEEYEKLNDIVEVWFDSGSTHSFVLEKRKDLKWPEICILKVRSTQRLFHSSLLESCGTRGRVF